MTDNRAPIDPARVLAALEVLGWPDDRGEQYAEDAAVMPAEAHYRLAEDVIRAVDAAGCPCLPGAPSHRHGAGGYCTVGSPQHHVITFADDGTWSLEHPATCPPGNDPSATDWDCPLRQLAERQITPDLAALVAGGRYACTVNDLRDVFQLEDRLHDDQCTPPICAACGCWCHDEEPDPDAVQDLLDDATRAFAAADTSSERVEVIRDLLAGWYAAWPAGAVTDEHEGIAHQIVALVYAAEAAVSPPHNDLADRLAAALADVVRRCDSGVPFGAGGGRHTGWIRADVVDGWRALLAEHADRSTGRPVVTVELDGISR
ncbi:hypothetical protein [Micromonospora deserti]|uniref:Uncharacterized protein n=1 Tax=Micromonospora deserti TaxID=2070366 RepID=A0A2W2CYR7_9ACTN|nr:hypothetical protein [Micromonospora deserti]PZF98534.1 hypothetical protein C1I99_13315 [Micromonospora deserti]